MSIPKIIHQTFKTKKLPFITRWHISRFLKRNPDYQYEFYDDERINKFLSEEYDTETFQLYKRINIGAAKADFFRYALLYKVGGIYLDVDSDIKGKLDFIQKEDAAIISKERNPGFYVQWAMVYEPNHPFLKKTLELVLTNIKNNTFPNDVHKMTGPEVYSNAINLCLQEASIPYRLLGVDYNGHFKFKYALSKILYKKGDHWKKLQLTEPVLKPKDSIK
jgi:mannosyltransferase OCH1-like enzyme